MNFAQKILRFVAGLDLRIALPDDVKVMNPFQDSITMAICEQFYNKFYADNNKRWMIIGINPGRFGGGVTGIPFTDPIRLRDEIGIENEWPKKQELSSVFVYDMIKVYGGPQEFYKKFYFTSISPLGFTSANKNLNYYDNPALQEVIKSFVTDCLFRQQEFGIHTNAVFCLGEGKNYMYLSKLNKELKIFDSVVPLSHPRFIMQYRLKRKDEYIKHYLEQFQLFC